MTDLDELERLLAKATPELLNGKASPKGIASILRAGVEHQRPRADNWDKVDCDADGAAIHGLFLAAPALIAELKALREALIWCSGSNDFNEGGIAREGWLKLCRPLLETRRAAAMNELIASTADEYGVQNNGTD